MKQKDIMLIIVVIIFSVVFSLLISNFLISPPEDRKEKVEVVSEITTEFNTPQPEIDTDDDGELDYNRFFNEESINPTQEICIGNTDNTDPFSEGQDESNDDEPVDNNQNNQEDENNGCADEENTENSDSPEDQAEPANLFQ